jgi:LPPG:FO 2-phospho-L-lactate transferase
MALTHEKWRRWRVVAFAGGVGGAKLAHGLAMCLPPGHLAVIVNTADDFIHYGLHISPDLDTVMYTLGGLANPATGWGMVDESWQALTLLERYGEEPWFRLGDRDLGTHLFRTQALAQGQTLTEVTRRMATSLGITQPILPATDDPIATCLQTKEHGELDFQEYFVKFRWQPTVTGISFKGEACARASESALAAISAADALIICPSNPLLSIEPVLKPHGMREAVERRRAPCVAVSPLIGGKAVKGPADKLMRELGFDPSVEGIARYYGGLIDGLVIDYADRDAVERLRAAVPELSVYLTQAMMETVEDRQQLAGRILNWLSEVNS